MGCLMSQSEVSPMFSPCITDQGSKATFASAMQVVITVDASEKEIGDPNNTHNGNTSECSPSCGMETGYGAVRDRKNQRCHRDRAILQTGKRKRNLS
jgi:hypothetical protein